MVGAAKEQLKILLQLQQKDIVLDTFRNKLEQIPEQIEQIKTELETAHQQMSAAKEQLNKFQLQRKDKEAELEQIEAQIKKHQQELNQVKTNEAFKALLAEIEKAKVGKSKLEDDILAIMEVQDQKSKDRKKEEQEFKLKEAQWNTSTQQLEEEKKKVEEQSAAAETERETFVQEIPPEALEHYRRIRAGKRGAAIVQIKNDACGGCNLRLPPHVVNEVMKGQELIYCESCQRILTL